MPCPFIGSKQFLTGPDCIEQGQWQNSVLKGYFWTYQKQFSTVQNNLDLPPNNLKVSKTIWFQNNFGLIEGQGLTVLIYTLCL